MQNQRIGPLAPCPVNASSVDLWRCSDVWQPSQILENHNGMEGSFRLIINWLYILTLEWKKVVLVMYECRNFFPSWISSFSPQGCVCHVSSLGRCRWTGPIPLGHIYTSSLGPSSMRQSKISSTFQAPLYLKVQLYWAMLDSKCRWIIISIVLTLIFLIFTHTTPPSGHYILSMCRHFLFISHLISMSPIRTRRCSCSSQSPHLCHPYLGKGTSVLTLPSDLKKNTPMGPKR